MQQLRNLIDGYQSTCILIAATKLGLFAALAEERQSLPGLARTLRADQDSLARLIRVLRTYGLVAVDGEKLGLTRAGLRLAPAHGGLCDQLHMIAGEYLDVWSRLDVAIAQGGPVFESVFHDTPWQHRLSNPTIGAAFNRMTEAPQLAAADKIAAAYEFSEYSTLADIGGGRGHLVCRVLARHPGLSALLFDLPQVISTAREWLAKFEFADRCRLQSGSFFEHVPAGNDLYTLEYVLHDWDDDDCETILRNCAAAMRGSSRLLILEKPLSGDDESDDLQWLALRDIHMMLVHGGRERTLQQYDRLLESASLQRVSHRQLDPNLPDIIEARRA